MSLAAKSPSKASAALQKAGLSKHHSEEALKASVPITEPRRAYTPNGIQSQETQEHIPGLVCMQYYTRFLETLTLTLIERSS
eukprot:360984-Pyramimonas_sp.AAC.1